jgi:hypothetical protein
LGNEGPGTRTTCACSMFEGGLRVKMESIDSSFHFRQPQCEYGNRIIVIVMMDSVPVFQQVLKIKNKENQSQQKTNNQRN